MGGVGQFFASRLELVLIEENDPAVAEARDVKVEVDRLDAQRLTRR